MIKTSINCDIDDKFYVRVSNYEEVICDSGTYILLWRVRLLIEGFETNAPSGTAEFSRPPGT